MVIDKMVGPAQRRTTPAQVNTMTPRDIYGILRRHLLLIASATVLGLIVGGTSWFLLLRYLPKYRARTFLKVLPTTPKDPIDPVSGGVTNAEIQYQFRASIASLIMQQSSLQKLIDRDRIQDLQWFKRFGDVTNEKNKCIRKAFRDLKNFGANPERDREFVSISMACADPEESAIIVNEMVNLFMASRSVDEKSDITKKLAVLNSQRDSLQRDIKTAEDALQDVRQRFGISDLHDPEGRQFQHAITLKLKALDLRQDDLNLNLERIQAAVTQYEEWVRGPVPVQVDRLVENDPVAVSLTQRIAGIQSALEGRLSRLGRNHREVRDTQDLLKQMKQDLRERKALVADYTRNATLQNAQEQLVVFTKEMEALQIMREEAESQQRQLDMALVQYSQRLQIRDERRDMLDEVKAAIETFNLIHDDPETIKVQPVGIALRPLEVSSPRWEFFFPGGTMLGLMFGVGLSFLIELLNDLVRTPRDVRRYLQVPLLGVIPAAAEDSRVDGIDLCHVVRQAPYSVISESYRRLRTNLRLFNSGAAPKVLLVTSGMAGEGKTPVAINLATTLIAENKKVLLVDANFRRPSLQKAFNQGDAKVGTSEFGLSALLMGLCSYDDALKPDAIQGLDILESGPLPPNPAELLGSYQMEQLINDRRKSYDYIIIDTPPVLLVSDAKAMGRFVDGSVLVFHAGSSRRGAALRTIRELKEVNATVTGCVLFAVKSMKGGYFKKQYKSYQKYQELQLAQPA